MVYKFNGKEIKIKDEEIQNLMDTLDLTEDEAIELWLDDNDYTENEEAAALTKKAKENRITATIHDAKDVTVKRKREVVRKENPLKENIIQVLAAAVAGIEDASNVRITNIGKLIEFECGGETFKLDLVQRRKAKNN